MTFKKYYLLKTLHLLRLKRKMSQDFRKCSKEFQNSHVAIVFSTNLTTHLKSVH